MQLKSVKGYSPAAQFFILSALFIGGFILASIAQLIITFQMLPAGVSLTDMQNQMMAAMKDPKNINLVRIAQVLGTFFWLCIPALLFSLVAFGKDTFWLGFNRYINARQIAIGFVIIFVASVVASPVADLSKDIVANFPSLDSLAKKMEDAYNEQVLIMSNLRSWPEYLMAILIMAFFPALFEEMFFRGALQNVLVRWIGAPIIAIIITSLLFSLIHLSIYLFLSRAILGFVLGLMYHYTKNIWVNVIAHFLNNLITVTQLFWMSMQEKKVDPAKLDPSIDWWYGVLAAIALVFLFNLLRKYSLGNLTRIHAKEEALYERAKIRDPFNQITQ